MKIVAYTLAAVLGVGALLGLGVATSWFGLVTARPMATYAKETERQVYMNSVAHQQGADAGIAIACGNMRNVSLSAPERHSYASIVISTAASYGGNADLSAESAACVSEARGLLAVALPQ